jgi:hypothetical protein
MKRMFLVFAFLGSALVFQPAIARGQTLSPVGSWEITILGPDRGNAMMTFSNDFTVSGYGITRLETGMFTLTGNWGFNSHGDVVVAYLQSFGSTNRAASFTAQLKSATRFTADGRGTDGHFRLKGEAAGAIPDLSGSWTALVKRSGKTLHELYAITASTNFPSVFDVTGTGLSDTGSFTLDGEFIANSHDKLAAFINRTFSGSNTVASSISGTIKTHKPTMSLHGSDDTGTSLTIKAVQ